MKLGWRPKEEVSGAPIPLYYDFVPLDIPTNPLTNDPYDPLYLGPRFKHSLALHKSLANKPLPNGHQSYPFKYPLNMGMIESIIKSTHRIETPRQFLGMNSIVENDDNELKFDSNFESGNLDMVIKTKEE